ncbi:hypothetical protein B0H19DRAFT_137845 [Mycena capillaripes]|nr:hypothetical protein B0H19DRAFT_137845 [Mycena capillaripes]
MIPSPSSFPRFFWGCPLLGARLWLWGVVDPVPTCLAEGQKKDGWVIDRYHYHIISVHITSLRCAATPVSPISHPIRVPVAVAVTYVSPILASYFIVSCFASLHTRGLHFLVLIQSAFVSRLHHPHPHPRPPLKLGYSPLQRHPIPQQPTPTRTPICPSRSTPPLRAGPPSPRPRRPSSPAHPRRARVCDEACAAWEEGVCECWCERKWGRGYG